MENSGNNRKKRILSGTASLKRRSDTPVQTNGPAGRKDGYQGRRAQFGASNSSGNSNQTGSNQTGSSRPGINIPFLGGSQNSGSQSSGSQSGSSGAAGGLGSLFGSKTGKILLLILVGVAIFFLIRCVVGKKSCSLTDLFGGEESGITEDYGIGETIPSNTVQQSFNQAVSFDDADNNAPAAVVASTSAQQVNNTVSNKARSRYTKIKGNGNDKVTVMIYLCGSDLESEHSMATADLNEMLHANLDDDHVNIIVETGGAKKWNNSVISNKTNQRYRVTSRGLQILDDNVGKRSMVDPNTLIKFIQFCKENYPANRYMLILWDHGGGAITGYGYDQTSSGSMTLDKLNTALKSGGVKFDFIGFDACLMATFETAVVSEQYADYMIASEEAEPGTGWYYTNWLSKLSANPSISTVELSKALIDDFTNVSKKNYPGCNTTLSIVDLAEFAGTVPDAFNAFSVEISDKLDQSEYAEIADARADAREFGSSSKVNHIDLIDFANRLGSSKAKALSKALSNCVKYNRTSVSMKNSNGLSIYFPYSSFKNMNAAVSLYDSIGISDDYSRSIKSFASLAAGGQIATGGSSSSAYGSLFGDYGSYTYSAGDVLGTLLGGGASSSDPLSSLFGDASSLFGGTSYGSGAGDFLSSILGSGSDSWFDSGRVLANKDYYERNSLTVADMQLEEKDDEWVLSLTEDQWKLVKNVQINVFAREDDHYVDLGMDNADMLDENGEGMKNADGDLRIKFDNTWMTVEGQPVAYHFMQHVQDGENWAEIGYVPILLNGERYYMFIVADNETEEHEYGYIAGVQPVYDESKVPTLSKGFIALNKGDKIDFIFDCYAEDGTYDASYLYGKQITVGNSLKVGYMRLGDLECDVSYCLTDIYGNEFWTETVTFN